MIIDVVIKIVLCTYALKFSSTERASNVNERENEVKKLPLTQQTKVGVTITFPLIGPTAVSPSKCGSCNSSFAQIVAFGRNGERCEEKSIMRLFRSWYHLPLVQYDEITKHFLHFFPAETRRLVKFVFIKARYI